MVFPQFALSVGDWPPCPAQSLCWHFYIVSQFIKYAELKNVCYASLLPVYELLSASMDSDMLCFIPNLLELKLRSRISGISGQVSDVNGSHLLRLLLRARASDASPAAAWLAMGIMPAIMPAIMGIMGIAGIMVGNMPGMGIIIPGIMPAMGIIMLGNIPGIGIMPGITEDEPSSSAFSCGCGVTSIWGASVRFSVKRHSYQGFFSTEVANKNRNLCNQMSVRKKPPASMKESVRRFIFSMCTTFPSELSVRQSFNST